VDANKLIDNWNMSMEIKNEQKQHEM
jgi:hypothetical protein